MGDISTWQVLLSFATGSFFGTLLGPILLDEIRHWLKERRWKKPRKDLLRAKLQGAKGQGWVSIDRLTVLTGLKNDACRTLLIEIDARGGRLRSGKEGWALIERQPLSSPIDDAEEYP